MNKKKSHSEIESEIGAYNTIQASTPTNTLRWKTLKYNPGSAVIKLMGRFSDEGDRNFAPAGDVSPIAIDMETKETESLEHKSIDKMIQTDTEFCTLRRSMSDCSLSLNSSPAIHGKEDVLNEFDLYFHNALVEYEVRLISQRLAIQSFTLLTCISFVIYLIVGVGFYSFWEADWPIRESLLFIMYSMTTVGYGNHILPKTKLAKMFTTFYVLVGIIIITLFFSGIMEYLVLQGNQTRNSRDRGHIARQGNEIALSHGEHTGIRNIAGLHSSKINVERKSIDYAIFLWKKSKDFLHQTFLGKMISKAMSLVIIIAVGAIAIGLSEELAAIDAIYFAVISMTTVGYGDIYPTRKTSVWIAIFWLPFSIFFMSLFISNVRQLHKYLHLDYASKIAEKLRKKRDDEETEDDFGYDEENMRLSASMDVYLKNVKDDIVAKSSRNLVPQDDEDDNDQEDRMKEYRRSFLARTKSSFLLLTSTFVSTHENQSDADNADFNGKLRTLVLERLALIIQHEILVQKNHIVTTACKPRFDGVTITFPNMKSVALKWFIPRKAREAFVLAIADMLLKFGKLGIQRGELFNLPPFEFHRLLMPVIAAMEPLSVMQTWLASTELLMEEVDWNEG